MPILKNIQRIKIIAPCLFFIPLVALFLSLFLNNHLLIYGKSSVLFFPEGEIKFGKFKCNEKNNFCQKQKENDKLTYCSKFKYHYNFSIDGKAPIKVHDSDLALIKNIPFEVEIIEDKNIIIKSCIKNSILYKFYELIPFAGNIFLNLKDSTVLGISEEVFPFIDGKTSISNIVRRYPFNMIFKPLMFITSILMIFYWINYELVFKKILPLKKGINYFTVYGILSAIFLFLHILFLGIENQSDLIRTTRKIIITSFILFEVLAEFYLAKKLFNSQNILGKYMYKKIILAKMIFVRIIIFVTFIVLLLLILKDMGSEFKNIAEWNYFTLLLIFYFLSAIAWKKKNPQSHTNKGV